MGSNLLAWIKFNNKSRLTQLRRLAALASQKLTGLIGFIENQSIDIASISEMADLIVNKNGDVRPDR